MIEGWTILRCVNFYREVTVPSLGEWKKDCERLLEIGIETQRAAQKMSRSRTVRQKEYSVIRANVADQFPNVQHLIANHLCGIGGMINCLPFWVTQEIEFHQSRPVLWMLDLFHLDVDTNDEDDACLLYTSPSPRDATLSRMPSSA